MNSGMNPLVLNKRVGLTGLALGEDLQSTLQGRLEL